MMEEVDEEEEVKEEEEDEEEQVEEREVEEHEASRLRRCLKPIFRRRFLPFLGGRSPFMQRISFRERSFEIVFLATCHNYFCVLLPPKDVCFYCAHDAA